MCIIFIDFLFNLSNSVNFIGCILQEFNWVLLQRNITYKSTPEVMYCGSVAVHATIALDPIPIQFYDPSSSSTASLISCSDRRCSLGTQSSDSGCSNSNHQCSYTFQYGDGSGTSGYYLSIAARNP
ncbi:hypothetical protein LXL04_018375 [Taraxacum kok-saghyz]